jgi:hypothetical protein
MRKMAAARLADGWVRELSRPTAGDFVLGGQGEPGGEVLLGEPPRHVGANLGEQLERGAWRDAIDLGEVHPAGEPMQRRADLEARFVVAHLPAHAGGRQGSGGGLELGGQGLHVRLDRGVTGRELGLTGVEELEILLQDEEVLGSIVPG